MKYIVNIGDKFGKLTVIRPAITPRSWSVADYDCLCDCGNYTLASKRQLTRPANGKHSCGCSTTELKLKNRLIRSPEYRRLFKIWLNIKSRCYDNQSKNFVNYGGRGIIMCHEWLNNFESFYQWSLENGYNESLTLDRVKNEDIYAPYNCRWATSLVQANNKRTNVMITYEGVEYTMKNFARKLDIPYGSLKKRIMRGWTIEEIATTQIRLHPNRKLNVGTCRFQ